METEGEEIKLLMATVGRHCVSAFELLVLVILLQLQRLTRRGLYQFICLRAGSFPIHSSATVVQDHAR